MSKVRSYGWETAFQANAEGQVSRYEVVGEGEPVVLVHGIPGSTRSWSRNIEALAARYRVYSVDFPSFGRMRRLRGG
jgi:pimeloyl-ACP methyl ester carboxylesterase